LIISYFIAFALSFIPAYFLTSYGFGILHILGLPQNSEFFLSDLLAAMTSITFITKPTHEVITILENIRKLRR
jgi:hypothetical protein